MKHDALRLRHKLAVALTCLPLSLTACEKPPKDEPKTQAESTAPQATTAAQDAHDTTVSAKPPPPPPTVAPPLPEEMNMPSCPTGTFETTQKEATALAEKDSYWQKEKRTELNCPSSFNAESLPDSPRDVYLNLNRVKTQAQRDSGDTETCAYTWVEPCPGGRVLIDGAEHRVAELQPGDAWSNAHPAPHLARAIAQLPHALRGEIARAWLADARIEHASVASFARATLELMLHGAPPHLLDGATRAAREEVAHARDAFALAALYSNTPLQAGPLDVPDVRRGSLAELACETFIEGCVGETVATLATTRALEHCAFEPIRTVLQTIVDEESNHAALAWSTLTWALETGGAPVAAALIETANALRPDEHEVSKQPRSETERALLAQHGRLDTEAQHEALQDAWRLIIDPLLEELLS